MLDLVTSSEAETRRFAQRLARRLRPGDVVALAGMLGAGKTTFVRGLAEGLGIDGREVSSPTFVLCHEYTPREAPTGRVRLVHLDGYRLASPDELETIGWDEILAARDAVIAVEWPERFGAFLPAARVTVEITHVDEHTRAISVGAGGLPAGSRLLEHLADDDASSRCPVCGRAFPAAAETAPFCSSRCRLVDLGQWLGESYRIGGE